MNLTPIKANMTELELAGGCRILFSYKTPVAVRWSNGQGGYHFFKTEKKWSATTTKHVNSWVEMGVTDIKPQEYFDSLIKEVK